MDIRQFVAALPAFANLQTADFESLLQVLHYQTYDEGHVFCAQGQPPFPVLHVLVEGAVRVTRQDDEGQTIDTEELRGGEIFGLLGIVDNLPAVSTAVATQPGGILVMTREGYQWLFAAAPTLALQLQYMIAVQLARELQYRNRLLRARIRHDAEASTNG